MPQIQDPFFYRSVVLLLAHTAEGSFGFVVNRQSNLQIADILSDLEIAWRGSSSAIAFVGGPVQPQLGTVLFPLATNRKAPTADLADGVALSAQHRDEPEGPARPLEAERIATANEAAFTEVAPGIALTQSLEQLASLATAPHPNLRLLLGYAGWSQDQLATEISRNDWIIAPVASDLVFASDPELAWQAALARVGIDAAALPTWTDTTPSQAN
jgi:putative transcriptional regulator